MAPAPTNIGPACESTFNQTQPNGRYSATMIAQNICIGAVTSDCSTVSDSDADGIANAFDVVYRR